MNTTTTVSVEIMRTHPELADYVVKVLSRETETAYLVDRVFACPDGGESVVWVESSHPDATPVELASTIAGILAYRMASREV